MYDAVIIGSGPNGLAAAIELARAGRRICVLEGAETIGGGTRTRELTLPGFLHDTCSAIHPLGVVSPFFQTLDIAALGLEWVFPPAELAHPFDDGTAAILFRSTRSTGETLGADARAWRDLLGPLAGAMDALAAAFLRPVWKARPSLVPVRFAWHGLRSCASLARGRFAGHRARALFAGCAAHSMVPLERAGTAAFALVLAAAGHAGGWPCARGGSGAIARALAEQLKRLGGSIETGRLVRSMNDLPRSRAVLFDTSPRQLAAIAGDQLPRRYVRRLSRFRQGPGVFKIDWALEGPIPWKARECGSAATVHVGGTFEEIAASESDPWHGRHPERPFTIVAQQSLFDRTRAPAGKHTGWAYCHVPNGSDADMTERIEAQIERFAPGFRDRILARHTIRAAEYERENPNISGGDIGGGANDILQVLARPLPRFNPYSTPNERLFLCSSSTPPGAGVHGMCGYWAARAALRRLDRS
ncbi:MAG: NAD(P)/FAD-dependent oxidoreductase [Acidobacteria bacterium]|nr:NAD(P)/FAD-dependent oxidoreductase [Acidobacteriota bacterium]